MHTSRLLWLALFLCVMGTGCAGSEAAMVADRGAQEEPRPSAPDSRADAFGKGHHEGEEPLEADSLEFDEDAEAEAPGSRPVRVRGTLRDFTTAEEKARPWPFAPGDLQLFVRKEGSFVPIRGSPDGPGEYLFPDVPEGSYYLKGGDSVLVTRAREVDLGFHKLLRDGVADVEAGAPVHVHLRNLEPWQDRFGGVEGPSTPPPYSDLQLVSEELGFGTSLVLYDMLDGATIVDEEVESMLPGRFEAARGDRARVVQLSPRELGPLRYLTAVRALHLPPFSHDGTSPLCIRGTLEPLPPRELALDWRVSAFTSLAGCVHPEAVATTSRFSLRPSSPVPATEGWMGFLGELMSLVVPPGAPGRIAGPVVYGNPSLVHTGTVARAATSFAVPVQTPDGIAFHLTASVFVQDRPEHLSGRPLRPRIQPPRGLTLDGTEAYRSRILDAGAHVIGWQPPSEGLPDVYLLRLQRLDLEDPSHPVPVPVLQFYVDGRDTSVRLPADILEPGGHYSLSVEAIASEGYAVWEQPLMLNERYLVSRAAALCGLLSVMS